MSYVFIRLQRYAYTFLERNGSYSLLFFNEEQKGSDTMRYKIVTRHRRKDVDPANFMEQSITGMYNNYQHRIYTGEITEIIKFEPEPDSVKYKT